MQIIDIPFLTISITYSSSITFHIKKKTKNKKNRYSLSTMTTVKVPIFKIHLYRIFGSKYNEFT